MYTFIYIKKYLLPILFILFFVPASHCKVVVFDHVTTIQKPIIIKVLTKAGFFAAGGLMVDIYLDNEPLKKILTGGDGYGYLNYTPQEAGLKKITAHSVKGSASGLILVMTENEKAILIEIEGAFKDSVFSDAIRERSQKAVNALSENYRIIYLSRVLGKGISGSWLKKQNFPKSVIIRWRGLTSLKSLKKNGVQIQAIIGSADVISTVSEKIEKRFSFEKTKDGKTVKDWDEILRLLVKSPLSHPNEDE
ncbi:MAG: N-acetylmuramoyl-L-alanine amidase [Desulfobacterales bacterium]|jgi:hypothetical protein